MQLHLFHPMPSTELTDDHALRTQVIQVIENCATAYLAVQMYTLTFRQEKAIQNDIVTTAFHQWYHDVVITS